MMNDFSVIWCNLLWGVGSLEIAVFRLVIQMKLMGILWPARIYGGQLAVGGVFWKSWSSLKNADASITLNFSLLLVADKLFFLDICSACNLHSPELHSRIDELHVNRGPISIRGPDISQRVLSRVDTCGASFQPAYKQQTSIYTGRLLLGYKLLADCM